MTEYTFEQAQAVFREQAKEAEYTRMFGDRQLKNKEDKYRRMDIGQNFIYAFLNRGMRVQVKNIKERV